MQNSRILWKLRALSRLWSLNIPLIDFCTWFSFTDIKIKHTQTDTCISVATATGKPYCDMLTSNIGLLMGGNGEGAKHSHEMGRIGAKMIMKGQWDHDLPQDEFKVVFQKWSHGRHFIHEIVLNLYRTPNKLLLCIIYIIPLRDLTIIRLYILIAMVSAQRQQTFHLLRVDQMK